jgi:hypothetical protein
MLEAFIFASYLILHTAITVQSDRDGEVTPRTEGKFRGNAPIRNEDAYSRY